MDLSPQQIIQWLESKQFDRVITSCLKLKEEGVVHPQLWLFIALAYGRKGDINTAEYWFQELTRRFGDNPEVHYNRGLILQENKRYPEAADAYQKCLAINSRHASAWNNLGLVKAIMGNKEFAITALRNAVRLQPERLDYKRNLAEELQQAHAFADALPYWKILTKSKESQLSDWLGLIKALTVLIQLKDAIDAAHKALKLYPNEPDLWLWLGRLNIDRRKYATAIKWLEKCRQHKQANPAFLKDLAAAYSHGGLHQKAEELFPSILGLETENAYGFVIELQQMAGRMASARKLLEKALSIWPESTELLIHKARDLRQQKNYQEALNLLDSLPTTSKHDHLDPVILADIRYEKGKNQDKLGRYTAAWDEFQNANDQMHRIWTKICPTKDQFNEKTQTMAGGFLNQPPPQPYRPQNTKITSPRLVFIVGFPRSGTTLIDNILAAHPEVTVLEEAQILSEVYESLENISNTNYAEAIARLSTETIEACRKRYFNLLPEYIAKTTSSTVVDKSPMNALHVALIHRLFPDAPILFAQRHPADVVLSCFMQNFQLNSFMTNLLDINQAARTYDAILSLWQAATENWQIPYYSVVYEQLVSDFEPQARELVRQAGLPWHDDILRYHEKTAQRGTITTPSYNQANQPVYTSSRYRHRNYLPQMQHAMKILTPWIEKLGYAQTTSQS